MVPWYIPPVYTAQYTLPGTPPQPPVVAIPATGDLLKDS